MFTWAKISILCAAILTVRSDKPQCYTGKLDIVLVVDVSGSDEAKFVTNRDAAMEVARALPISWEKASVAVIQYSRLAIMKLEFGSSETIETINDTIMNLEWTGDVQLTAEAMDLAMIMFRRARPDSRRAIVLFSDGNSFNNWQQVVDTAERLRYSEAKIWAVSLSGNTYDVELNKYIEFSNGTIIRRRSEFEQLKEELKGMTVPRCPPPAASPPPDFLRPAENNPDGESIDNQLPTRRSTRRNPITRAHRTSTLPSVVNRAMPPVADRAAAPPNPGSPPPPLPPNTGANPNPGAPPVPPTGGAPPPVPPSGATVVDAPIDKRR